MSEEKKKRKNPSGVNTHEDTDANGELDSPAADEPAANEGTSSPAPPPISESSENPRTECPRRRRGRSRPGLTPRTAPMPKVRQTAQLLTNPRQPKRLLHRHHRLRRSSHPGSTPRMITTLRARVAVIMQPFVPRLLRMLLVEVSHGDRLVISTRS